MTGVSLVTVTTAQAVGQVVAGVSRPILFGVVSGTALVLGSMLGVVWGPSDHTMGVLLAFAGGALVTAAAYELIEPAFRLGGNLLAGGALLLGAVVFAGADYSFGKLTSGGGASGWSLLASVTLDGIPENTALGIVLLGSSGAGLALVAAFFASNVPQALGGTRDMLDDDYTRWKTVAGWCLVAVAVGGSVPAGNTLFAGADEVVLAGLRGFAGGAILASLADEVFPEAYDDVSSVTAVATALGFLMTHLLK